ncbi:MAG: hypothetical protein RBR08_16465 [Desulforegulaceae bacterium]|nr:hypothetical protein [Desulforegulaceae bacterium]
MKIKSYFFLIILSVITVYIQSILLDVKYSKAFDVTGCKWCEAYNYSENDIIFDEFTRFSRLLIPADKEFISDLLWLRLVYYFGTQSITDKEYPKLLSYLIQISEISPKWLYLYKFGGIVLLLEANQPYDAMFIVDKGLSKLDLSWELFFLKGYILWQSFGDYASASEYFYKASRKPKAPIYLLPLSASLAKKTGDKSRALKYLEDGLREMIDLKNREIILKKIREIEKSE